MFAFRLVACVVVALTVTGCANLKKNETSAQTAFVPAIPQPRPVDASDPLPMEPRAWFHASLGTPRGPLTGRTLDVSSVGDIKLAPKEVILTFDDGPVPGKTERILDTLDLFRVKATFLMVGEMAKNHPDIARKVVARGHSVGSHTWRHANLSGMNFDRAMTEIMRGETAVRVSTGADIGFFRFPYLADTGPLRAALARRGTVVLDVGIDSKDYFKSTPSEIVERTMTTLAARQSGIILLHDIHARTELMLPQLLSRLQAGGYKVVALRHKRSGLDLLASAQ
ncbi:polysaccharide deacetylase family protein [Agrobacterium sp. ES01]|uniref:polysaccharide deacetylase family protein n=1 Tax=Agrobacterium sp. ES01 TaxID=3420714 RepID=UPI003D12D4A5